MEAKEQYEARKTRDEARRKIQAEAQNRWWFNQPQPIDRFTGWLVAWTALLFIASIASAAILLKTDSGLQEQITGLKRLLDLMESDQRPWISVQVAPGAFTWSDAVSPTATAPIVVTQIPGVNFTPHFILKNVGKSPAANVAINSKIYLSRKDAPSIGADYNNICNPTYNAAADLGYTIFPNDTLEIDQPMFVASKDIDEAVRFRLDLQQTLLGKNDGRKVIVSQFLACVVYKSSFAPSGGFHTTRLTAFIESIDRAGNFQEILADGISIPKERMKFLRDTAVGNDAD